MSTLRSTSLTAPLSKLLLALAFIATIAQPCAAKDKVAEGKKLAIPPSITAEKAAKGHLKSYLKANIKKLEASYADKVTLAPGHELLKPEYELVAEGKRDEAATFERAKLMAVLKKDLKEMPDERIEKLLDAMAVEALETKPGDFATDPADPVETPDGKLHFQIRPGDKLIKVTPKKGGDFILFQFRPTGGEWKIVAEYLD